MNDRMPDKRYWLIYLIKKSAMYSRILAFLFSPVYWIWNPYVSCTCQTCQRRSTITLFIFDDTDGLREPDTSYRGKLDLRQFSRHWRPLLTTRMARTPWPHVNRFLHTYTHIYTQFLFIATIPRRLGGFSLANTRLRLYHILNKGLGKEYLRKKRVIFGWGHRIRK